MPLGVPCGVLTSVAHGEVAVGAVPGVPVRVATDYRLPCVLASVAHGEVGAGVLVGTAVAVGVPVAAFFGVLLAAGGLAALAVGVLGTGSC